MTDTHTTATTTAGATDIREFGHELWSYTVRIRTADADNAGSLSAPSGNGIR